ncbi:solute carrier family 22 member 6-like [Dermacentor albipictus]|uniref:solute carrier family 22 member 6-like n=1 Tax=Dermacentor albipictus TaxID=60249 RepID=UPI0038FC584E
MADEQKQESGHQSGRSRAHAASSRVEFARGEAVPAGYAVIARQRCVEFGAAESSGEEVSRQMSISTGASHLSNSVGAWSYDGVRSETRYSTSTAPTSRRSNKGLPHKTADCPRAAQRRQKDNNVTSTYRSAYIGTGNIGKADSASSQELLFGTQVGFASYHFVPDAPTEVLGEDGVRGRVGNECDESVNHHRDKKRRPQKGTRTSNGKSESSRDKVTCSRKTQRTGETVDAVFKSEETCLQHCSGHRACSRTCGRMPYGRRHRRHGVCKLCLRRNCSSLEKRANVEKANGDRLAHYIAGDAFSVQTIAPEQQQYIVSNVMDGTQSSSGRKNSGGARNAPYGESHVQFIPPQVPALQSTAEAGKRQRVEGKDTGQQGGQQWPPGWPLALEYSDDPRLPAIRTHEEATTPSFTTATMQKIDNVFRNQGSAMPSEARISGRGYYQWLLLACAYLATVASSYQNFSVQLLAPSFDYWCKPPPGVNSTQWKITNIPLDKNGRHSRCSMYEDIVMVSSFRPTLAENGSRKVVACAEWAYDVEPGVHTVVSYWGLVCDRAWLVYLITVYYNIGSCIIVPLLAQLSDKRGRRKVIVACVPIAMAASAAQTFATAFSVFLLARVFFAAAVTMLRINTIVLLFETTSPSHRDAYVLSAHSGYVTGSMAVTLLEPSVLHHRIVSAFGLVPTCLLIASICLVEESPRWLLDTGQLDEFHQVQKRITPINGAVVKDTPPHASEVGQAAADRHNLSLKQKETTTDLMQISVVDLFSNVSLRYRTVLASALWFSLFFCLFGIWNLTPRALTIWQPLTAVMLRSTAVIGAYLVVKSYSRKGALMAVLPLAILPALSACLSATLHRADTSHFFNQLALTSVFAADAIVELYSLELFPTVMRVLGLSVAVIFSRFGVALASLLKDLAECCHDWVPLAVVACALVSARVLVRWLPETKNVTLAESVYDVEVETMKHTVSGVLQHGNIR